MAEQQQQQQKPQFPQFRQGQQQLQQKPQFRQEPQQQNLHPGPAAAVAEPPQSDHIPQRVEVPHLDGLLKEKSVAVDGQMLADKSAQITCFKCGQLVNTRVEGSHGLGSIIACCLGLEFCLCWIPLCFSQFKTHEHICPGCNTQIGVHKGYLSLS